MITSDATANAESEVNIPTAPIPSTHVSNNSSNNSSRNGPVAVKKRKHIIGLVLEWFPSLYLSDSSKHGERFDLNSLTLCPLCNGDHKEESL
ncbi:unnamed protein product [Rhizophagus irregularis]|nr:unnamed protein product [Rhizophagus irregularis]